jgi:WD40 repeat protein
MARPVVVLLILVGSAAGQSPGDLGGVAREPVVARLGSDRLRQTGRVEAITYSPDGKQLVTADVEAVHVWDATDGRNLHFIPLHDHEIFALRFAADGKALLAATVAGGFTRLCRLDPSTGELIANRQLLIGKATGQFSPDAKWLALHTESAEELRVIDTATGEATVTDRLAGAQFTSHAWGADGTAAAAVAQPDPVLGRVRVYDPKAGKRRHEWGFDGTRMPVLAVSPDGRWLVGQATSPQDRFLARFDTATGKVRWRLNVTQVSELAVTADGSAVLYYGSPIGKSGPNRWRRLDAATGKPIGPETEPEYGHEVALRPDMKRLAVGGFAGHISQWDLTTGRRLDAADPPVPVTDLRFGPDGKTLRGWARGWYEWDVKTGKQTRLTPPLDVGPTDPVVVSHDQRWLGRFVPDVGFTLTDLNAGGPAQSVNAIVRSDRLRFLPSGGLLVRRSDLPVGGRDALALYNPATGRAIWTSEAGPNQSVAVAADAPVAVTVLQMPDGARVTRWDLATGRKLGEWAGAVTRDDSFDTGRSWRPALSADGRLLMLHFTPPPYQLERGGRVGLFDARTGRRLCEWDDTRTLTPVFSPDGRTVVCPDGRSGGLELWETATGRRRHTIRGLRPISACAFAPDGRTLAVSVSPGPVEIWDSGSDRLTGPTSAIESWAALAGESAEGAYEVVSQLRSIPAEAVAFLKKRMTVPEGPTAAWVAERLKGLDAPLYRDREKASADLLRAGDLVVGQLWDALPTASPEARERLTTLITRGQEMTPDKLRAIRGCEILEAAGTPEARSLLAEWAKGPPGSTLTREAAESLGRLGKR